MKPFKDIAGLRPRRSVFDNSYYKIFDCKLGQLIPVFCDLFLPGDQVKISVEALVRANPLLTPVMHRIDLKVDYFKVPLRIMFPKPMYTDRNGDPIKDKNGHEFIPDPSSWEDFITGGVSGKLEPIQPKWLPTSPAECGLYSLWDYFGNPLGIPLKINAWQKRAYQLVYNEYFRATDLEDPVDLDDFTLHLAKWEKDYFTSALTDVVRGTAPSVPLSGQGSATFNSNLLLKTIGGMQDNQQVLGVSAQGIYDINNHTPGVLGWLGQGGNWPLTSEALGIRKEDLNVNSIDMSKVSTFDVNDLRYIFQIQKYLERSMRAGSRYTEQILAHWGVHNGDARLQRPEYIGGMRSPVVISEVLQTSSSDATSPQGTLAGHGIGTANQSIGSTYCNEHCVVIGIMRLMPKPAYQQGINRQWLYDSRFEYPTPELVNLGEQEIFNMELCATADATFNKGIFGYQGRYDEHRVKQNMVCGSVRSTAPQPIGQWQLARIFDVNAPPALNKEFLDCVDDQRYSAVQNFPSWIVTFGNRVRRVAPLPVIGTPGLIDHN